MGASKPSPLIPETPADSQQLKASLRIHLQNQISFAFSCLLLQGARISGSTGAQDGCTNLTRASSGQLPGVVNPTYRIHTDRISKQFSPIIASCSGMRICLLSSQNLRKPFKHAARDQHRKHKSPASYRRE